MPGEQHAAQVLNSVLREDRARILARVVRFVGDLQTAEDALQDACVEAARSWPAVGVPLNPQGWLVTVARRRAVDRFRSLSAAARREYEQHELSAAWHAEAIDEPVPDDRLRLIFTCCHPALSPEVQVALTLQVVAGMTIAEIAAAFIVTEAAMSQRITRGKRKIKETKIAYRIPDADELPRRVRGVLATIYLVFNAGYLAPKGEIPVRVDLLEEAIRLGDLMVEVIGDDPEVLGLAALMQLTDARRDTRVDVVGLPIDLTSQDRTRWNADQIRQGLSLLARARASNAPGPYQIQAAIAAVHARSPTAAETDWAMIATLYDGLAALVPSPAVAMNRAVAIGLSRGPDHGLALLGEPGLAGALGRHHRYHASIGHLHELNGDDDLARESWQRALELTMSEHERSALRERICRLDGRDEA